MLIGAAEGVAAASLSGNPYVGVVAAGLACLLANLIFGYLVIERRANQLAAGLSLMFFGFGASTLIGRPFVGALVPGLPRIARARPRTLRHPGLARGSDRASALGAPVPDALGACAARGRRGSGRGVRGRATSEADAISRRSRWPDFSRASAARISPWRSPRPGTKA